jgi:hypothetical protein
MINLLYHSHTVVPAHLNELETLGFLDADEQVLVAIDGVLLDAHGLRLSGPTLHDYCLITSLRVVLWARDYGRHLCYAFPLAELSALDGCGVDPLHAQISLTFSAPDEEEQQFTFTLVPVGSLQAALTLLHAATSAARELMAAGMSARATGPEIATVLGAQIYGHVDGLRPGEAPYRWPGQAQTQMLAPNPQFLVDPTTLPPGQFYTAGRLARSAWDTLRRSLREADLPFELNSSSLREITETVRAVNDLVHNVASNPMAQQMAMAFLNRQMGQGQAVPPSEPMAAWAAPEAPAAAAPPPPAPAAAAPPSYHEIPLRRRGEPRPAASEKPATAVHEPVVRPAAPTPPDRREIPLRRRNASPAPAYNRPIAPVRAASGSGDADSDQTKERV